MKLQDLSTFYIPEGKTRTVTFPTLRPGNEEGRTMLADDRGTLLAPAYIEEAETDELLLLKQYNAGTLIGSIRMMVKHDILESGQPLEITRLESGGYEAEPVVEETVETADDVM